MHDTKERLSPFWLFALLNYLYADVLALWCSAPPHLPPWVLAGSAVLMEYHRHDCGVATAAVSREPAGG